MVNRCGVPARELAHGLDAFPIGDRHELGFVLAVLAERLDTQCLGEERLDAGFIVIGFIGVGMVAQGSPAPNTSNTGLLLRRDVHDTLLIVDKVQLASRPRGGFPTLSPAPGLYAGDVPPPTTPPRVPIPYRCKDWIIRSPLEKLCMRGAAAAPAISGMHRPRPDGRASLP
jgi:hypothetical protein